MRETFHVFVTDRSGRKNAGSFPTEIAARAEALRQVEQCGCIYPEIHVYQGAKWVRTIRKTMPPLTVTMEELDALFAE